MHMKRALGTITPWELFAKATEIKLGGIDDDIIQEGSEEEESHAPAKHTDVAVMSE